MMMLRNAVLSMIPFSHIKSFSGSLIYKHQNSLGYEIIIIIITKFV